jgi:hypothetical protein
VCFRKQRRVKGLTNLVDALPPGFLCGSRKAGL